MAGFAVWLGEEQTCVVEIVRGRKVWETTPAKSAWPSLRWFISQISWPPLSADSTCWRRIALKAGGALLKMSMFGEDRRFMSCRFPLNPVGSATVAQPHDRVALTALDTQP